MEAASSTDKDNKSELFPAVPQYCPVNVRGLKQGEVRLWCACGLSNNQPWCDGSHVGTGIKPVRWKVPHQQSLYQLCNCKYTSSKPLCDGSHIHLPLQVIERREKCEESGNHTKEKLDKCKLCTGCGWIPDF